MRSSSNHRDAAGLIPSPLYSGERVRVRGRLRTAIDCCFEKPLTPVLCTGYRGEGVKALAILAGLLLLIACAPARAADPEHYTFRNHVQPVLAKFGCSSGACHGAAAGQNGFKLSLRGYDDLGDWRALTRNALGRRIIPADPGRSLLLLKPTATIPHKGGKRFEADS